MKHWGWMARVGLIFAISSAAVGESEQPDVHSMSRPDLVRVKHLELDLTVDFPKQVLRGSAIWTVERDPKATADTPLILDTRDLSIESVQAGRSPDELTPVVWTLGNTDPILGSPLAVRLPEEARWVQIDYRTSPSASALQWVAPSGTAGQEHPFLYSQAEAIHARSFVPCQDTPGARITFEATLTVPENLQALMAAEGPERLEASPGEGFASYRFRMRQSIPSYLIALAVGDLEFQEVGPRTGVWAEPSVLEKAAWEFGDMEAMLEAVESVFGPYRWDRYDVLVLPPSFPFGGMENPRLTFATPTVLAGDRSQVALIAHELAHSWAGNLVTNASWNDFWLNEGFTVYLERRILEEVYGPTRAAMEAVLGFGELKRTLDVLPAEDQTLHARLGGRDPDDGITLVPYEKGALFLTALEKAVGRERLDAFLRGYFDHFAFQSLTTPEFEAYLRANLFDGEEPPLDLQAWLYKPGIPANAPKPKSERLATITKLAQDWQAGTLKTDQIDPEGWTTLEWLQFLRSFSDDLDADRLASLDSAFQLTETGNSEIATQWLVLATRAGYQPAEPRLEEFLVTVGRRKFLMPLYQELAKTPEGRGRARRIFAKAKAGYHPLAIDSLERLLKP